MEISPVFIDYVTIRQDYFGGGLPVLNDGRVLKVDADGEIEYSTDVRCIIKRLARAGNKSLNPHLR